MPPIVRFYTYRLKGTQAPVTLNISIGNGQSASTILRLDHKVLNANLQDSLSFEIPNTAFLAGKQLDIITTVADVNTQNNDILLQLRMSGGEDVLLPAPEIHQSEPFGVVHFFIKVIFL